MKTNNEKGFALISIYLVIIGVTAITMATWSKSFIEVRQVDRELARVRGYAAAEAGLQSGMAQIGANAYTGFINTSSINVANFQSATGQTVGSFVVEMQYPDQADWVIVQTTGTVNNEMRTLEGRVFLDSNLSKYLVYADTANFGSGDNAQYGEPDNTDNDGNGFPDYPEKVPANEDERAAMYFTGDWTISGANVHLYGDSHAQGVVDGNVTSKVHGDTYVSTFAQNSSGQVTNSGVLGGLPVMDGFADDTDRNQDSLINSSDFPDRHDLTATGDGDAHPTESLVSIDHNFYAAHNNIPGFAGGSIKDRFLKFEAINNGAATRVVEYTNANYTNQVGTFTLPNNAIVYVKGDIYAKGEIGGRVSVVSSDDIFFENNLTYAAAAVKADPSHSTAFLAKDKLYFKAGNLSVSGILYAENSAGGTAFDASQGAAKQKLRLYGNRVMKGVTNLSLYPDRVYAYDNQLKLYRPPGIPVVPDLRLVRDAT